MAAGIGSSSRNPNQSHTADTQHKHTLYLSLKKRRKPKAMSLRMDSSTKVEVKK